MAVGGYGPVGDAGQPLTAGQGTPNRIRTCDLRFRKPLLYPLSYRGIWGRGGCGRFRPPTDRHLLYTG